MAHIRDRGKDRRSARWQARYRDPSGRQISRAFERKLDAERWLTSVEAAKLTGGYVDPKAGRVTFREYAEDWRHRQLWRESTAAKIESDLRNHLYPAIGDVALSAVRPSDLDVLVKGLADKLAPSTVESVYRLAATVFKSAIRDRLIAVTPCENVKLPEKPRRDVVPLTVDQVAELADLMPDRYRALVVLGAGTGLRLSEALGLTVDRVAFLEREITVDRQLVRPEDGEPRFGPVKRAASNRVVPLPDTVAYSLSHHLKEYGKGPEGLFFTNAKGKSIYRTSFSSIFRRAADQVGIAKGDGFHELRHHYASLLISSGCSVTVVQRRLGHATAQETLDTYSHLWPDDDEKTISAVDGAWSGALVEYPLNEGHEEPS